MNYTATVKQIQSGFAYDILLLAMSLKRAGETGKREGYLAECQRIEESHGADVLAMVKDAHSVILLNPEAFGGLS